MTCTVIHKQLLYISRLHLISPTLLLCFSISTRQIIDVPSERHFRFLGYIASVGAVDDPIQ